MPQRFILILIFTCVAWPLFSRYVSKNDKINGVAYVSYSKMLKESTILDQEKTHIDQVIALANTESTKTAEKYYAMPEPIRREIATIYNITTINRLKAERSRARRISHKVISDEVEMYRLKNHYSVVFNKDIVTPPNNGRDISGEIINKLRDIKVDYGKLPIFEVEDLKEYN